MQRLLMGEVGTGKTVVALAAMLRAVENGAQAALMAPTETLAEQHHRTLDALLGGPLPVELLTGSTSAARRRDLLARLADGQLQLVVGTHALIEDAGRVPRPRARGRRRAAPLRRAPARRARRQGARSSVAPGSAGCSASAAPHALHMTATPIPRTLSLTAYGDLDATVLRELPRGRRPVETHVVDGARARARAYERIREEIAAGRQCFVVCPLVEESEALQAKAATAEFERLRAGEFRDLRVELIHGQLPSKQKAAAMEAFAAGEADVLVATSVIEVGIDVPNATVMLIEAAERYGLSQLHQLRGRVGRGAHQSLCILFGDPKLPRLEAIASESDGFRLAEIDLELRGAGDVLGTRQHGLPEFRVARLPEDTELLVRARDRADEIVVADPGLERARARAAARGGGGALRPRARPDPGVRIVAGEFKGRRLRMPRGAPTRPTADRVREALFSMLGDVDGRARARPLRRLRRARDRGALARRRPRRCSSNATRAPPPRSRRTSTRSAPRRRSAARTRWRFVRRDGRSYDLVFCDPPYDSGPRIAGPLAERLPALLSTDARIVTESDKRNPLELPFPLLRERTYGDTRIAIHGR